MTAPDDSAEPSREQPSAEAAGIAHPAPIQRMAVPPWVQLVGLPLVVFFGYLFARAASHAVIVFLIACLISLLLAPVVRSLNASGIPRVLSVFLVFGAFAATVTVLTISVVQLVAHQADDVQSRAPKSAEAVVTRIDDLQHFLDRHNINVDLRDQGVKLVDQLQTRSAELSSNAFEYGREFVTVVAAAAFNLVLVIVITVYMLLDAPRIGRFIASLLPRSSNVDLLFGRMQRSLLRYTIGQTLASLVMGASAALGLWLLGVTGVWDQGDDYAVLFGAIVAITEFAPSIGPVIGAVPPIVTAAFAGPGPAIAVALLFLLLHQVEGHIVIPKLMGAAIAVHPLLVIFGILAGAQLMGVGGVLLALPVLAVGREIVFFLRERLSFSRFSSTTPQFAVAGAGTGSSTTASTDTSAEPDA